MRFIGKEIKDSINVNERVKAREVRLIDDEGKQFGIIPTSEALKIAKERGLDLVEVSPKTVPPV